MTRAESILEGYKDVINATTAGASPHNTFNSLVTKAARRIKSSSHGDSFDRTTARAKAKFVRQHTTKMTRRAKEGIKGDGSLSDYLSNNSGKAAILGIGGAALGAGSIAAKRALKKRRDKRRGK
jgi:hypothetical protein